MLLETSAVGGSTEDLVTVRYLEDLIAPQSVTYIPSHCDEVCFPDWQGLRTVFFDRTSPSESPARSMSRQPSKETPLRIIYRYEAQGVDPCEVLAEDLGWYDGEGRFLTDCPGVTVVLRLETPSMVERLRTLLDQEDRSQECKDRAWAALIFEPF